MTVQQREWPSGEDRAVVALSAAIANVINSYQSEVTPDELRKDARSLGEFLKLLMAMDAEQSAKEL